MVIKNETIASYLQGRAPGESLVIEKDSTPQGYRVIYTKKPSQSETEEKARLLKEVALLEELKVEVKKAGEKYLSEPSEENHRIYCKSLDHFLGKLKE